MSHPVFRTFLGYEVTDNLDDAFHVDIKKSRILLNETLTGTMGADKPPSRTSRVLVFGLAAVLLVSVTFNLINLRGGAASDSFTEGAQILQKSMMNNEAIMQLILTLQTNPDFQKVLQDQAIMQAVNAGDIAALLSNPAFQKLLNNPAIGRIKDELGK